jgi:hypothetical protein
MAILGTTAALAAGCGGSAGNVPASTPSHPAAAASACRQAHADVATALDGAKVALRHHSLAAAATAMRLGARQVRVDVQGRGATAVADGANVAETMQGIGAGMKREDATNAASMFAALIVQARALTDGCR